MYFSFGLLNFNTITFCAKSTEFYDKSFCIFAFQVARNNKILRIVSEVFLQKNFERMRKKAMLQSICNCINVSFQEKCIKIYFLTYYVIKYYSNEAVTAYLTNKSKAQCMYNYLVLQDASYKHNRNLPKPFTKKIIIGRKKEGSVCYLIISVSSTSV